MSIVNNGLFPMAPAGSVDALTWQRKQEEEDALRRMMGGAAQPQQVDVLSQMMADAGGQNIDQQMAARHGADNWRAFRGDTAEGTGRLGKLEEIRRRNNAMRQSPEFAKRQARMEANAERVAGVKKNKALDQLGLTGEERDIASAEPLGALQQMINDARLQNMQQMQQGQQPNIIQELMNIGVQSGNPAAMVNAIAGSQKSWADHQLAQDRLGFQREDAEADRGLTREQIAAEMAAQQARNQLAADELMANNTSRQADRDLTREQFTTQSEADRRRAEQEAAHKKALLEIEKLRAEIAEREFGLDEAAQNRMIESEKQASIDPAARSTDLNRIAEEVYKGNMTRDEAKKWLTSKGYDVLSGELEKALEAQEPGLFSGDRTIPVTAGAVSLLPWIWDKVR